MDKVLAVLRLLLVSLLAIGPALHPASASEAATIETPHGLAWLALPGHGVAGPVPAVLILADRTGPDGREVPYADYLLAAGIAVIQLATDAPEEAMPLLTPSALAAMARRLAPDVLDPTRIGLLGFGAGARVVLATREGPVAALYPSCRGLPPVARAGPVLLLHPDDAAEAAACRRVSARAEAIGGGTHGWDHGQVSWLAASAPLPHPDGSPARLLSQSDGRATQESVARVVRHFRDAFGLGAARMRRG